MRIVVCPIHNRENVVGHVESECTKVDLITALQNLNVSDDMSSSHLVPDKRTLPRSPPFGRIRISPLFFPPLTHSLSLSFSLPRHLSLPYRLFSPLTNQGLFLCDAPNSTYVDYKYIDVNSNAMVHLSFFFFLNYLLPFLSFPSHSSDL